MTSVGLSGIWAFGPSARIGARHDEEDHMGAPSKIDAAGRPSTVRARVAVAVLLSILLAACTGVTRFGAKGPASSRPREPVGSRPARPSQPTAAATAGATSALPIYGIAAGCCIQWMTAASIGNQLDAYQSIGAKWIRFDFTWSDIQSGGPTSYTWANYEKVVNAATA